MNNAQQRIIETVRTYVGCSLDHREQDLREFLSRGIDNPATLLGHDVSTCGLFALAVWHACGVQHELIAQPYEIGMAIDWLVNIAHDLDAVRSPKHDGPPVAGALMHYFTRGHNNDHVEFCLSDKRDEGHTWIRDHAGGGRHACGIGEGTSLVNWSSGRPLQQWFDPRALLLGVDDASDDNDSDVSFRPTDVDIAPGANLADETPPTRTD